MDVDGVDEAVEPANGRLEDDERGGNWVEFPDYFPCGKTPPVMLKLDDGCFRRGEYTKGVKWSPDGWCCMVGSGDMKIRIFELPPDVRPPSSAVPGDGPAADDEEGMLCLPGSSWGPPFLEIDVGDALYDFDWYPGMTTLDPNSYKLALTSKNSPIHVYDALYGGVKATFSCYDDVDEVRAATSVAFSPDGLRLFAGMRGEFRCFDVSRPGRDCLRKKLKKSKLEADRHFRQTGIVSCFAFNPQSDGVVGVGSYDKSIGLYSFPDLELWSIVPLPAGSSGGVTCIKFSADGTKLVASSRKDDLIRCWDTRMMGGETYWTLERPARTTQRFQVEFDPSGRFLASGSSDGDVRVWDVATDPGSPKLFLQWQAHEDCCSGVSFHPWLSLMSTGSGQRHIKTLGAEISNGDGDGDSGDDKSLTEIGQRANPTSNGQCVERAVEENSLKLWWCGEYRTTEDPSCW